MHVVSHKKAQWLVYLIIVVLIVIYNNNLKAQSINDECVDAEVIIPSYSYTNTDGTFEYATQSQAECGGTVMESGDVWYKFEATDTKHAIVVTVDDHYSYGDVYMQVFSGNCASLTSIACVDDEDGFSDFSYQEKFVYSNFVVGQTYYIRTYYSGYFDMETFRIGVLRMLPSNATDACTNATQLSLNVVYSGENISATRLGGVPQTNDPRKTPIDEWGGYNSSTDNTVWYKFMSNSIGGNITVDFSNLQFAKNPSDGIQFTIYQKNSCQTTGSWGVPVAGIFDFTTDQSLNFTASANTMYYLVVDGSSGELATWNVKLTGNVTTLPVELVDFKATCQSGDVMLTWITASETNNDYFTVEKSNNAIDFEEVDRVKGAGNSNYNLKYSISDKFEDVTYYRLKQTDYDGRYSYSEIVPVNCTQSLNQDISVSVYPNPSNDWFVIKTTSGIVLDAIEIYAVTGLKVKEYKLVKSDQEIDLADLTDGLYLVKVFAKGRVCCIKLQKKGD